MDVYVGFDSAWTDNPRAPGAIAALGVEGERLGFFQVPTLASFDAALALIRGWHADGVTLVALDQPTIVRNETGMRPVERAAASVISWLGGGVQPSNRGRRGMFCDASPIWRFLAALGAVDDPPAARAATNGLFVVEVFPALALASLDPAFCGRLAAPRYNPARRRTWREADFRRVAEAAAREADARGAAPLASWCREAAAIATPKKADQDRLDAALCLLVALRWRRAPPGESAMLGDLETGYIVAPVADAMRARLQVAAARFGVALDGTVPARHESGRGQAEVI